MTKDYSDPELSDAAKEVIDYLDQNGCGMTFSGLRAVLPHLTFGELNAALLDAYEAGEMNRVEVLGPERSYPVFYSLDVMTAKRRARVEDVPVDLLVEPQTVMAAALASVRPVLHLPKLAPVLAPLSTDDAVAVLERAGWTPEPEVAEVIERRVNVPDRRRLTALDVIRRWRLPFPLARVVEIIGESRKGDLAREDAAIAIRMIREQVRGDE